MDRKSFLYVKRKLQELRRGKMPPCTKMNRLAERF